MYRAESHRQAGQRMSRHTHTCTHECTHARTHERTIQIHNASGHINRMGRAIKIIIHLLVNSSFPNEPSQPQFSFSTVLKKRLSCQPGNSVRAVKENSDLSHDKSLWSHSFLYLSFQGKGKLSDASILTLIKTSLREKNNLDVESNSPKPFKEIWQPNKQHSEIAPHWIIKDSGDTQLTWLKWWNTAVGGYHCPCWVASSLQYIIQGTTGFSAYCLQFE